MWVAQGARTHVPLQAQELQRGSGDFSQDAQVSLCRVGLEASPVGEAGAASVEPPSG